MLINKQENRRKTMIYIGNIFWKNVHMVDAAVLHMNFNVGTTSMICALTVFSVACLTLKTASSLTLTIK